MSAPMQSKAGVLLPCIYLKVDTISDLENTISWFWSIIIVILFLDWNISILFIPQRAWKPDVILFESKTISLTFELQGSLGIPRPVPSALKNFALGAGLGIPSEPHSSKVSLIVLLSIEWHQVFTPKLCFYFMKQIIWNLQIYLKTKTKHLSIIWKKENDDCILYYNFAATSIKYMTL